LTPFAIGGVVMKPVHHDIERSPGCRKALFDFTRSRPDIILDAKK
jgi:hypothetical protein